MRIDEEVGVRDETTTERSKSVSVRLVDANEVMGFPAVYMNVATRTRERVEHVPGGPLGRIGSTHTDGPFLTFHDTRGGGLTREQWETFKRAGDQAWNEWETRFASLRNS